MWSSDHHTQHNIISSTVNVNEPCSFTNSSGSNSCSESKDTNIKGQLMKIKRITEYLSSRRNEVCVHREKIVESNNRLNDVNNWLNSQTMREAEHKNSSCEDIIVKMERQKEAINKQLSENEIAFHGKGEEWVGSCKYLLEESSSIQCYILDNHLENFKRAQQLSGNGAPLDNNLDTIQSWCEELASIWFALRNQINLMSRCYQSPSADYQTILREIDCKIGTLVKRSFIVEVQPPQVLKTNTRFSATIRSLMGSQLKLPGSKVNASILSETQARNLMLDPSSINATSIDSASGILLNREAPIEYHGTTNQAVATLRTMSLKRIVRTERRGDNSVTDEKFTILFQSVLKTIDSELTFPVKVLSLPAVAIVHGNQETHAWATISWDNAFSHPSRLPYVVPERVPWWVAVDKLLNLKFAQYVGCKLAREDILYLAKKALRNPSSPDPDSSYLNWLHFAKEALPEKNFTFWEWFYYAIKLTRDHLRNFWNPKCRSIYGFITRKQTEELLCDRPEGTFLLRFSETELGRITIAYKAESRSVYMIQPFSSRDLQIRSLADRIKDLQHLKFLYPDIPKDVAFGKFYESTYDIEQTSDGYIKPLLVTHIPEWAVGGTDSRPNTPRSNVSVDIESIINDIDSDMDDFFAELPPVGLNDLMVSTNMFNQQVYRP